MFQDEVIISMGVGVGLKESIIKGVVFYCAFTKEMEGIKRGDGGE